eukprot:4622924-Lingulodinium_polyedra.AAC.1
MPAPGRIAGGSGHWPRSRAARTASEWRNSPLKSPMRMAGPEAANAASSKATTNGTWARALAIASVTALVKL